MRMKLDSVRQEAAVPVLFSRRHGGVYLIVGFEDIENGSVGYCRGVELDEEEITE